MTASSPRIILAIVGILGTCLLAGLMPSYGYADNALQVARKCPEIVVPQKGGGYGLIITGIRVKGVSCRKGGEIVAAAMQGDPLPSGWSCSQSKKTYYFNCKRGKKRARGTSGGSASGNITKSSWQKCKPVAFEKNTDWGATQLRAKKVGCRTARKVARDAKGVGSEGSYSSHGFECTGSFHEPEFGMPFSTWRCLDGSRKIRFRT